MPVSSLVARCEEFNEQDQQSLWRSWSFGCMEVVEMQIQSLPDPVFYGAVPPCIHVVPSLGTLAVMYGQQVLDEVLAKQDAANAGWPAAFLEQKHGTGRDCDSDGNQWLYVKSFGEDIRWNILKWPSTPGSECSGGRLYLYAWSKRPNTKRVNKFPSPLNKTMYSQVQALWDRTPARAEPLTDGEREQFHQIRRRSMFDRLQREDRAAGRVGLLWTAIFEQLVPLDVSGFDAMIVPTAKEEAEIEAENDAAFENKFLVEYGPFLEKFQAFWHDEYWAHYRHYLMLCRGRIPNKEDSTEPRGVRLGLSACDNRTTTRSHPARGTAIYWASHAANYADGYIRF